VLDITTSRVKVSAGELHTHQAGDPANPAILWLHGSGPGVSALSNWEKLISTMPAYWHIAPDLLGFADSSHPDDLAVGVGASGKQRAESIFELLTALGVDRTHVVGNSMGGMITLLMLQAKPELFDRVILMGSGGAPIPPTPDLIRMVRYYEDESPESMQDLISRFVFDQSTFGESIAEIASDRAAFAGREDIRRSHLRTFTPEPEPLWFPGDLLATIQHEILVVHGREDRIIPVEASYHLAGHLPNAQLHVLPHAGHWVQIEQVDRFRALATLFLNEESATKGINS
jgi:2-hydroxymuconate-semialdehyde hydrolase